MIRVTGLTKDYGARRAINDLNFNIEKGEVVGFLGPNGAGKTTTMRILTGYMPPSYGKVEIGGYDVIDNSLEVRKLVGYLPETVPLYPDLSIREYLRYMAKLRNVKKVDEKVNEVLAQVEMVSRADSLISNLSKGMRQRVGLAQALIHEPQVLILDEPTIGLDPAQIVSIRSLIQQLGEDRTVLLSTHILPEAQQVCDRVLIINKGKIVAEDTTERLQARLTGSQRIIVQVRGEISDIVNELHTIPGILQITQQAPNTCEIETSPGEEVRPEVARRIVSAGMDLLQLEPVTLSLEEIFLQLTRDETTSPDQSDDQSIESEPVTAEQENSDHPNEEG
ncbi:MAG TPA: ABC transporter ATP-binding protein [Anaerolineaceae bacterium]